TFPVAGTVKDFLATTSFRFRFAEDTAFTVVSLIEPAWPAVAPKLSVRTPFALSFSAFASADRSIVGELGPPGPPGPPGGPPPPGLPPADVHFSSDSGPGDASFTAPTL